MVHGFNWLFIQADRGLASNAVIRANVALRNAQTVTAIAAPRTPPKRLTPPHSRVIAVNSDNREIAVTSPGRRIA